ncbi:ribonucleoside hydrolase RihC [Streptococcus iniae]|uniref:nucleoside hydrolase n=1 Tax=Streptococcus iniae TaxID=1346 RepID=UPI0008DAA42A|nr:nucleoside hydrolase [Streptococcus iniae]OHX26691.1 ribonucleoside hydrolase RihC [Streptococcus iniae]RLV27769.1 ribonucleoside hydrolase RihC [Streptococcus iniae]
MVRNLIIDTDPGIDDATAITLALMSPKFQVRLISTIGANVTVDQATTNALKLVAFLEKDVPVARGSEKPLLKELQTVPGIHGVSGMDGYHFPEPKQKALEIHAVEAMRQTILAYPNDITIVSIGAMTNLALLISMYPDIKKNITEIVMMGGAIHGGNTSSLAEFNVASDPHAAAIVFSSGIPLTMIGLDVTEKALFYRDAAIKMKESGPTGQMLYQLFEHYGGPSLDMGMTIHDASTIAYLSQPNLFTTEKRYLRVVTEGLAAGAIITNSHYEPVPKELENVTVCMAVDHKKFEDWILSQFIK